MSQSTGPNLETPMMKQYLAIKEQHQDAILFFRMGDFYEMFLDDAQTAANELGITLTSRTKGSEGRIPMAGVPYHSAEPYINRLVRAGYKVAICEQVTEPGSSDIVEREVVRVVTPSTLLPESDDELAGRHYLMTFAVYKRTVGISLLSAQSGEVLVTEINLAREEESSTRVPELVYEYATRFQPAEIILSLEWYDRMDFVRELHRMGVSPFLFQPAITNPDAAITSVREHYRVQSLEAFGLSQASAAPIALVHGISYLTKTQQSDLFFLKHPQLILPDGYLQLTGQTIHNLELFSNIRSGRDDVSLFGVMDQTVTPMGKRLLKKWMLQPLLSPEYITARYDVVEWFLSLPDTLSSIRTTLDDIADIERSVGRLSIGIGNARDLVLIRESLKRVLTLQQLLAGTTESLLSDLLTRIDWAKVEQLTTLLSEALVDEPPVTLSEGGLLRDGYNEELDSLRRTAKGGKEWIQQLEQRERQQTGISTLKISSNKVFGYYIEISKTQLNKVPDTYIRRQTLTNAERFIIQELKDFEHKVFSAEDSLCELEYSLFKEILQTVLEHTATLQTVAELVATSDVLGSFSQLAQERRYVRPAFTTDSVLEIKEGRHPVIEQIQSNTFVPNDVYFDDDSYRMMVLTGANMAGKSTFIRMTALLVIMAQIGSFVPAAEMTFSPIDQIHTRIGAMDNLAQGLSTFMVEMVETANILNNLTDRSLVILDEVGRGTSTYDGLSIAWAVSEHIVQHSKAKVLFATHYFELTQLDELYEGVNSYHMEVSRTPTELIFLYRVKKGRSDQSYGIEVAQRAGLPESVILRARVVLDELHQQQRGVPTFDAKQMSLF